VLYRKNSALSTPANQIAQFNSFPPKDKFTLNGAVTDRLLQPNLCYDFYMIVPADLPDANPSHWRLASFISIVKTGGYSFPSGAASTSPTFGLGFSSE